MVSLARRRSLVGNKKRFHVARHGTARRGKAGPGEARPGKAWPGKARQGFYEKQNLHDSRLPNIIRIRGVRDGLLAVRQRRSLELWISTFATGTRF